MQADTPLDKAMESFPKKFEGHDFEFKTKIIGPGDINYDFMHKKHGVTSETIFIHHATCRDCGISFLYKIRDKVWIWEGLIGNFPSSGIVESCSEYKEFLRTHQNPYFNDGSLKAWAIRK